MSFANWFKKKPTEEDRTKELVENLRNRQLPLSAYGASVVRFTVGYNMGSKEIYANLMLLVGGKSVESVGHFLQKTCPEAADTVKMVIQNYVAYIKEFVVRKEGLEGKHLCDHTAVLFEMALVNPCEYEIFFYDTMNVLEDQNKRFVNADSNVHYE